MSRMYGTTGIAKSNFKTEKVASFFSMAGTTVSACSALIQNRERDSKNLQFFESLLLSKIYIVPSEIEANL